MRSGWMWCVLGAATLSVMGCVAEVGSEPGPELEGDVALERNIDGAEQGLTPRVLPPDVVIAEFDEIDETIAAGANHSCAVRADATAMCWGYNLYGQLGNGAVINSARPVTVSGLTTVHELAAGANHTCALLTDKTVRCWGDNRWGQLGDGTTVQRNAPVAVVGLTDVTEISAGAEHTCAVLSSGGVRCWGGNLNGQLGDNSTTNRSTPVTVVRFNTIVVSPRDANRLGADRLVVDRIGAWYTPLTSATDVDAGNDATCARLSDGTVHCWGGNQNGQLGDGTKNQRLYAAPVAGLSNVTSVSVGGYHACASLSNGHAKCWGLGNSGQLANMATTGSTTPTAETYYQDRYGTNNVMASVTRVSAGEYHTCFNLRVEYMVFYDRVIEYKEHCAGMNWDGQLGVPANGHSSVALESQLAESYASSAGGRHTCVRLWNGVATCVGSNLSGQGASLLLSQRACSEGRTVQRGPVCTDEVWDSLCVAVSHDEFDPNSQCTQVGVKQSYPFICNDPDALLVETRPKSFSYNCYGFSVGCTAEAAQCGKDPDTRYAGYGGDNDFCVENNESESFFESHGWKKSANHFRECDKRKTCSLGWTKDDGKVCHQHSITESCDGEWESKLGALWGLVTDQWGMVGPGYGGILQCYERYEPGANADACAPGYSALNDPLNRPPFSCLDPYYGPRNQYVCKSLPVVLHPWPDQVLASDVSLGAAGPAGDAP